MKKIALSTVLIASLAVSAQARIYAQSYTQSNVSSLLKKIEKLEAKVKENSESVDELYDRADENEFQATMNRIKWGGELEVTDNFIGGKTGSIVGSKEGKTYNSANQFTTKLRLSMESKINDKTKFAGRLSMYKNWSNSTSNNLTDPAQGRKPSDSSLYVERAYVDYAPVQDLIFTIGRQPSSDGPGMTLIQNTKRKSTYPALLFDGAADGIVTTYKMAPQSSMNPVFRLAYGKGFQDNTNYSPYTANQNSIEDLNVYGVLYEMSLPFSSMGDNLFVLSYVLGTDFVGHPQHTDSPNNNNLGDMALAGAYFENNKAFGTNFSYFVSAGLNMPDSNGKTVNFNDGKGDMALIKKDGFAVQVGGRYDFDNGLKVGYEYNYGSKYWYSFTNGSSDILNKLATRGSVNDVYAIYQLDLNQFLRVGYTAIDYEYTGSGWHIGEPMKTNDYVNRAYMTYNVRF